jgi:hypothetical protein
MKVPLKRTLVLQAAALGTDVDGSQVIGEAPFDGAITSVKYIPNAAITGANTNTRRVAVTNRGQAGAGTTEAAALQFNAGVNGVKWDAKAITLIADPAADVVAGDVLTFDSTAPGTGVADPGGLVIVEITRDDA